MAFNLSQMPLNFYGYKRYECAKYIRLSSQLFAQHKKHLLVKLS